MPTSQAVASRPRIKRNPVGKLVTEQMRPLLDKIDIATSKARSRVFVDTDWSLAHGGMHDNRGRHRVPW